MAVLIFRIFNHLHLKFNRTFLYFLVKSQMCTLGLWVFDFTFINDTSFYWENFRISFWNKLNAPHQINRLWNTSNENTTCNYFETSLLTFYIRGCKCEFTSKINYRYYPNRILFEFKVFFSDLLLRYVHVQYDFSRPFSKFITFSSGVYKWKFRVSITIFLESPFVFCVFNFNA